VAEGLFMMGLPRESKESMRATIDFAKALPLDDIAITIFTPLPGTKLYRGIKRYGRFEEDWHKMSQHYPVFVPSGLTREIILDFNNKGLREFYLRPRMLIRNFKRIKSIQHLAEFVRAGFLFVLRVLRKGSR
jgi:anaerobic magnesium-protoporphyrin IX monomethyl ester cyclase